ncbi:MAG: type III ribulose-bisphosphate carboxylase [Candidatus Nanoarchaeia archaeon]
MGYDFIKRGYKPSKNDLICLFNISSKKMGVKEAANKVALESSIGTWTDVHSKQYVNKLGAKVFSISGNRVKIAYPQELFERGNITNILSSIAGNIFGMKGMQLRLEDVDFPKALIKSFPGPRYGINGVRKILKIKNRPLIGTIIKPKLGLKTKDHANVALEAWQGGCDIVKDDENLSSQTFNPFEKRVAKTLEMRDRAEEQGEKKIYLANVTAESGEMVKRADIVKQQGGRYVMLDILTAGFASLQTLRRNTTLGIHAHRAMHGAFTENPKHGISMMSIADFARLAGVDTLHIGTGIGKMKGKAEEIEDIREEIEMQIVKKNKNRLAENWGKIKPVMAVCSGGLHPGHIPFLIKHYGKDIVIQAGGGIHGHPAGTCAGSRAMRQAVDACLSGISLKEYAKTHNELSSALDKWKDL